MVKCDGNTKWQGTLKKRASLKSIWPRRVPSSFPSPGEKKMRLVQSISSIDLIYQEHDLSMVSFQIENEKHNSSQTNVTKFICKYKGNSFLSYWKICIWYIQTVSKRIDFLVHDMMLRLFDLSYIIELAKVLIKDDNYWLPQSNFCSPPMRRFFDIYILLCKVEFWCESAKFCPFGGISKNSLPQNAKSDKFELV